MVGLLREEPIWRVCVGMRRTLSSVQKIAVPPILRNCFFFFFAVSRIHRQVATRVSRIPDMSDSPRV